VDEILTPRVGARIYGLGAVVLGLGGLFWGDFAVVWQPDDVSGPAALGYAVPLLPLLAGLAVQWQRSAALGVSLLIVLYCLAIVVFDIPRGVSHPSVFVNWYGVFEHLALAAGGLVSFAYCAPLEPATAGRLARIGRMIFGVCLIYFGLAHHFYLAFTVAMVPAWLPPGQTFWAYATAAGHVAAGIAFLSGIYARIAAQLLTAMFVVFTLLVHAPRVIADPHTHMNWAENDVNFALIGCACVIAASLRNVASAEPRGIKRA
jgi:uncharacterized membrane protein YphA (DoxX/SURF4 family)